MAEQINEYRLMRQKKNAELKNVIQKAKDNGVHESIIHLLEAYDKLQVDDKIPIELHDGADEEQITAFEKSYGIKLPKEYREFLEFSNGAGMFEAGCIDIFGVNKAEKYSLYTRNEEEIRRVYDMDEKLPDHFLIIGSDGEGNPICADLNTGKIIFWDLALYKSVYVGVDFFNYLEEDVIDFIVSLEETDD